MYRFFLTLEKGKKQNSKTETTLAKLKKQMLKVFHINKTGYVVQISMFHFKTLCTIRRQLGNERVELTSKVFFIYQLIPKSDSFYMNLLLKRKYTWAKCTEPLGYAEEIISLVVNVSWKGHLNQKLN